ncbi:replication initiator protein A [Oscillospiraceae bacterium 38-13]
MPEIILSDYFYGDESEEFVYFKIPRQLITNPKFKHVSTDAKLLYGMLLDRMSLSARNDWYDKDTWRVYIYYTVEEICEDMTCGRDKAMKLLAELDTKKSRLIEDFLETLSPENRAILMRRHWFSDSYGEIAVQTGLSEKNVSVRLTRIRKQLRHYFEERGVM